MGTTKRLDEVAACEEAKHRVKSGIAALVLLGAYMLFDHLRTRRGRDLAPFEQTTAQALVGSNSVGVPRFRTGDLAAQARRVERRPPV